MDDTNAAAGDHHEPASVLIHKSGSNKGATSVVGVTAGAVVISIARTSHHKPGSEGNAQAYHSQREKDTPSFPSGGNDDTFFLAVMAPTPDAAMQFLSNRPPGAHTLVKDEDDNVAVFVKFRQAVRAVVLIKAKEMKRLDGPIMWGRPYKTPHPVQANATSHRDQQTQQHSTMMTPIHRMKLTADLYLQLEQCWKRFLPQVKAILLQMCCEPYFDEDLVMDNWATTISSSQMPCIVALTPQSCGFYILSTNSGVSSSSGSSASNSGAVPIRHVEFDYQKSVITVADGTFNPTAFIVSTHFSAKRLFDVDLTFKLLRDNFLTPDRVMLKETTVTTVPVQQALWQNCIESNCSDPEFTSLLALQTACWKMIPHEPLPDTLLGALRNLHLLFVERSEKLRKNDVNVGSYSLTWPKEKIKMASRIIPYLLELMVAAASGLEWIEANLSTAHVAAAKSQPSFVFPKQKLKILHQFARVLRFDIVYMIDRCDEAMIHKAAHHIFQFFAMRCDLPAEFIELIRDLLALLPEFRAIFLKNQCTNLLWKALHTGNRFQLSVVASFGKRAGISPITQAIMEAKAGAARPKSGHERKSSLFGIGKKAQLSKSRKSVDFGTTFAIPVVSSTKPLVFLRINPLLVQAELASTLCLGQIEISKAVQEGSSVGSKYAFCFCPLAHNQSFENDDNRLRKECSNKKSVRESEYTGVYNACKRKKRSRLSPKLCMYELVLQLTLELMHSTSSRTWEKDAGLLLRLENVHESLFNEIVQQMKDAITICSKDEAIIFPDIVLADQVNYCRLRVVIKCVSDLFRLELKRRNQMKTALGDKKYWYFIHLFRSQLRDFNDYLEGCSENENENDTNEGDIDEDDGDNHDEETDRTSPLPDRKIELLVHIEIFRWIPRALLDEWIVLSLEDFLQTASVLSELIERRQDANPHHIEFACQLLQIFRFILLRSTDVDLQTLLVRVLNRGCSSIISLLQHLATVATKPAESISEKAIATLQVEIFSFLYAYATLDVALPTKNLWIESNPGIMDNSIAKSKDVEVIEQRKAVLMASVLSSTPMSEHVETNLWDYLLFLLIPKDDVMLVERAQGLSFSLLEVPTLPIVHRFQQKLEPNPLTPCKPFNFKLVKSFQMLQQLLYVSLVADSLHARIDFHPCISSHMHCIERYCKRYLDNVSQENPQFLLDAVEWHIKNLIALGNRRTYFPAIANAFDSLKVIPTLLNLVESEHVPDDTQRPASRVTSRSKLEPIMVMNGGNVSDVDLKQCQDGVSGISEVTRIDPTEDLAPIMRLKLPAASIPRFDFGTMGENHIAASTVGIFQNAKNHALVIILIVSYLILDSNLDLDSAMCPRFAIPGALVFNENRDAIVRSDLLWSLQQHLASVKLNVKAFERMIHDLETALIFSTSARVAAVRSLMRLLVPSLLDRDIYVRPRSDTVTTAREFMAQPDQTSQESELKSEELDSPTEACTYVTKGAFSTVYRSVPLLPKTNILAIKVIAHQKRAGDLSVLSDLYNEVAVLRRLQGEHAAIQMLDYGNRHEEQNFVIMMEFCPCTLNEWRASLGSGSLRVPFRSLVVMVLQAYEQICHSLIHIHCAGVGHFDIKGDNILLRTGAWDLTRRLLVYEERENYESEAARILKTSFCFADFGESMILESEHLGQSQSRTTSFVLPSPTALSAVEALPTPSKLKEQGFLLTRTRGTEAIKSPEMLKVKGSDGIKEYVTFSSDIWSMGCLLYEMITQELMFGKDDAAGLYTHLVISQATVLREDHVQKIREVLNPKDEPENLFVSRLIGLCEKILTRSPSRLSVTQLLSEVQRLLEDILQFPNSSEDKRYVEHAFADSVPQMTNTGMPASSRSTIAQSTVAKISSLPSLKSRLYSDAGSYADHPAARRKSECDTSVKAVFCRFFWNLHIGGIHDSAVANVQLLPRAGVGDRATSASSTFMDAFEAAHEAEIDHFVYFLWDDNPNSMFNGHPDDASAQSLSSSLVNELSEEDHRTCFFINSKWIALRQQISATRSQSSDQLDVEFFKQVDLDSHQFFPVFQRLLRSEPGRVLFLGVGKTVLATEAMNDCVVSVLLFFLQTAFSLGTTEALTFLARECGQHFGYPRIGLLQLENYASRHQETLRRVHTKERLTNQRYVVGCLCGESVFAVHVDAIKEASYHHSQQCPRKNLHSSSSAAPSSGCFHPFPPPSADDHSAGIYHYDGYPADPRMIYEVNEERLMFPFESRSKRQDEVPWVEVDIRAVERLESLFGTDLTLSSSNTTTSAIATASESSSNSGAAGNTARLNGAPLSSRASGPGGLLPSFRERKKQRRRQREEQLLAGVGEQHCCDRGSGANGMVTALVLGLKERSCCALRQQQQATASAASSTGNSSKPRVRKLFECELCCFPVCALSSDHEKVAIPLYFGKTST